MTKQTKEMLRKRHPNWTLENINHVLSAEDNSWEQIKRETLLENPCVKCGREMGEHDFSVTKGFICST